MKYRNRLGKKIAEKKAFEQEQKKLRKKYKVEDEGIIQVRKKRLIEILIKSGDSLIRKTAAIVLIMLAAIGLIALVYTEPRAELKAVLEEVIRQLQVMIGA